MHAQEQTTIADAAALEDLTQFYRSAIERIGDTLSRYADAGGQVRTVALGNVLSESRTVLSELERLQQTALFERMREVAALGVEPFAELAGAQRLSQMVNASVKAARDFIASDGLQLSDRLWRIDRHAKEVLETAISSAVIQGTSASAAAQDFLQRGELVPTALQQRMRAAGAGNLSRVFGQELMTGAGTPYQNARRLFRTEINRAHVIAYRSAAFETPGVVGTRFLLSPNHPETDICDLHAKANIYGLGPGVYPRGKSPLPAHPNTISYEVVVFDDEVTDEDRAGRQSRLEFLAGQPKPAQVGMLGGVNKQKAFEAGLLTQNQIATPWRVLKPRFEKRGIDLGDVGTFPNDVSPVESIVPSNPFSTRRALPLLPKRELALLLDKHAKFGSNFKGANQDAMQSIASAVDKVWGGFSYEVGKLGWIAANKARGAEGLYSHYPDRRDLVGFDSLELRKTYVQKTYREEPLRHQAYLARREKNLAQYDRIIADLPDDSPRKEDMRRRRTMIANATRWTHSGISNDPIFSTTAHEAGHALHLQGKDVREKFLSALSARNVTREDWYLVSEYAATNDKELFAEVTAFMASGDDHLLPVAIREAYIEAMANYRRYADV